MISIVISNNTTTYRKLIIKSPQKNLWKAPNGLWMCRNDGMIVQVIPHIILAMKPWLKIFLVANVNDSLSRWNGMKFSTRDKGNDRYLTNCARDLLGGTMVVSIPTWMVSIYMVPTIRTPMGQTGWTNWFYYSLKKTEIKITRLHYRKTFENIKGSCNSIYFCSRLI